MVAIALGESGANTLRERVVTFDRVVASNLLAAEVAAALARDAVESTDALLAPIQWIFPVQSLEPQIARVLAAGYLRGGDLWHVASALYFEDQPSELTFLTLDKAQREIARRLGFAT